MSLTLAQAVTVAILAISSFFCGWFLYRLVMKGRVSEFERVAREAKGLIPQLETSVRSRDQRIETLGVEIGEWKARLEQAEGAMRERERDVMARDRALRALNAELSLLKETSAQIGEVDGAARNADALAELQARLDDAERRNGELQREIESVRATPAVVGAAVENGAASSAVPSPEQAARIAVLEAELVVRDRAISELEDRLQAESAHGATLATTVEAYETHLAAEREEIAKWRARVPKLVESLKERDDRLHEATTRLSTLEQTQQANQRRTEALEAALNATKAALANAEQNAQGVARAQAQSEERLAALAAERDALSSVLAERDRAIVEERRQLEERDARIAELTQSAEDTRNELSKKLATSIRLGREEIDRLGRELGGEIDRITRELGDAITRRNEAAESLAEQRERVAVLERELGATRAQLERAASESGQVEKRVAEARAERDAITATRDALAARVVALETELAEREARAAAVQQEIAAAHASRAAVETERARAEDRIRGLEAECEHLGKRLLDAEGDLAASLVQMRAAEARADTSAEAARTEALASRDRELAELRAALDRANAKLPPIEEVVRQRDAALGERAVRVESLLGQVKRLEETLAARSAQSGAEAPGAEASSNEKVQYLEQRVAAQFERNRELNAALEDRERKLAELVRDQSLKEKSLLVLQQQLEHLNASNERLAGEVHALRAERDACADAATQKGPASADAGVAPERPQGLFNAPPERIDDLKQIRGIGESFEHRLNELGIYQFRQIAALNEPEAVWVEDALKMFRGRIGRDDWVGQALALIAGDPWLHSASTPAQHPTP